MPWISVACQKIPTDKWGKDTVGPEHREQMFPSTIAKESHLKELRPSTGESPSIPYPEADRSTLSLTPRKEFNLPIGWGNP